MVVKKKHHPKFNIPNYGAKGRSRVKKRWRKQRGIDSNKRVKKATAGSEPTIGYKNPSEVAGIRANGKRALRIRNINELMSVIKNYKAEEVDITIAKSIGKRKRLQIIKLTKESGFKITNGAIK